MDPVPSPFSAALSRWPHVPACYGWLGLDRRGQWRLQGEPVHHEGLKAFLAQHYRSDDRGCWFVQNGPQQVFVELAATPWVLRYQDGGFLTHTGLDVQQADRAWLDEEGNLLLLCEHGPAQLDDRDLAALLPDIRDAQGQSAAEDLLLSFLAGAPTDLFLHWRDSRLTLESLTRSEMPALLGYVAQPTP